MCGKLKRVSLFSSQVKAGLQIVENGRSSKYWNQIRRTGRGADLRGASPSRCCSFLPLLRSNPSVALNCSGLRSRSPCVLPAAQVWIWKSIFSVRLVFALSVQFSLDQNVLFLSLYEYLPRPQVLQHPRHLWDFQSSRSSGLLSCWAPWAGKILLKVNFYVGTLHNMKICW